MRRNKGKDDKEGGRRATVAWRRKGKRERGREGRRVRIIDHVARVCVCVSES